MKVTSYYPVFYAENLEEEARRYIEDLGFSVVHKIQVKDVEYYILDNGGNRIDLIHSVLPFTTIDSGFYGMRVNVDDFDEGYEYFKNQGRVQEGDVRENDSSKSVVLVGRDGMRIVLFHHKK